MTIETIGVPGRNQLDVSTRDIIKTYDGHVGRILGWQRMHRAPTMVVIKQQDGSLYEFPIQHIVKVWKGTDENGNDIERTTD